MWLLFLAFKIAEMGNRRKSDDNGKDLHSHFSFSLAFLEPLGPFPYIFSTSYFLLFRFVCSRFLRRWGCVMPMSEIRIVLTCIWQLNEFSSFARHK